MCSRSNKFSPKKLPRTSLQYLRLLLGERALRPAVVVELLLPGPPPDLPLVPERGVQEEAELAGEAGEVEAEAAGVQVLLRDRREVSIKNIKTIAKCLL